MTEAVTDLVRGTLCPALKAIFQHGLKKPSILGGPCHPWLFIEEVGNRGLGSVCLSVGAIPDCSLVCFLLRQPVERWRGTLTQSTPDWCCVRRTGNLDTHRPLYHMNNYDSYTLSLFVWCSPSVLSLSPQIRRGWQGSHTRGAALQSESSCKCYPITSLFTSSHPATKDFLPLKTSSFHLQDLKELCNMEPSSLLNLQYLGLLSARGVTPDPGSIPG